MTHLEGPWLTLNGRKKGKVKFRTSEDAQKARQIDAEWKELQKKWGVEEEDRKRKRAMAAPPLKSDLSYRGSDEPRIQSRDTGWVPCVKAPDKEYTGTKMIGVAVMHKSCLQPVFSQEAAEDSAKMRR